MESRSVNDTGTNVDTEVFILNTEIADEVDLDSNASTVIASMTVTNDLDLTNDDVFTTNTLDFQTDANTTQIVVYVRASGAFDKDNQVFYDNFSLIYYLFNKWSCCCKRSTIN